MHWASCVRRHQAYATLQRFNGALGNWWQQRSQGFYLFVCYVGTGDKRLYEKAALQNAASCYQELCRVCGSPVSLSRGYESGGVLVIVRQINTRVRSEPRDESKKKNITRSKEGSALSEGTRNPYRTVRQKVEAHIDSMKGAVSLSEVQAE